MANIVTKSRPASLNAAKHFCTSRTLIIGDEKMEEFDAFIDEFSREYKPRTNLDWHWVEGAARCLWFSRRSCREFDEMMHRLGSETQKWDEKGQAEYDRFFRYRKADEREFERAYRGIEHLRVRREQRRKQKIWEAKAEADIAHTKAKTKALESKLPGEKTATRTPAIQKSDVPAGDTPGSFGPIPQTSAMQACAPPAKPLQLWEQRVFIKIVEGAITLKSHPTNEQTRLWAKTIARPGARVERLFRFRHGVPPAFEWMLPPEERKPDATCRQVMPLETWLEITAEEDRLGEFLDHSQWRKPAA